MELFYTAWVEGGLLIRALIILLMLHPIASAITRWTVTPTDDFWYGKIYDKIIRPLALNKGLAMQEKPKNDG